MDKRVIARAMELKQIARQGSRDYPAFPNKGYPLPYGFGKVLQNARAWAYGALTAASKTSSYKEQHLVAVRPAPLVRGKMEIIVPPCHSGERTDFWKPCFESPEKMF
ncbi:MAG: hypothetical protein WAZ18_05955 [Alphaproteobacteria bacterium]